MYVHLVLQSVCLSTYKLIVSMLTKYDNIDKEAFPPFSLLHSVTQSIKPRVQLSQKALPKKSSAPLRGTQFVFTRTDVIAVPLGLVLTTHAFTPAATTLEVTPRNTSTTPIRNIASDRLFF